MSTDTMEGKILLPEQIDPKENRFNNNYFDRGVWFIEDYVSGNRLDFCHRYLNLGTYEDVYDDIIEFFSTRKNPLSGSLMHTNCLTGQKIVCRNILNDQKRVVLCRVDNSKPYKKQVIRIQERMPDNYDDKNS